VSGSARERYNRVARTARHLVAEWNSGRHALDESAQTLRDVLHMADGEALPTDDGSEERLSPTLRAFAERSATTEFSAQRLRERLWQFHRECNVIVPGARHALARGDVSRFAQLVRESQSLAERGLGNQIPETTGLVHAAEQSGALAASAFGAGFGGSVWAAVPRGDVDGFVQRWRAAFVAAFPMHAHRAQFFTTAPSPPAFELRS
jgi:galactokinase